MDDLQKLLNKIKGDVQKSLQIEVGELVKEKISEHVEDDVYDYYTPSLYKRTGDLANKENMEVNVVGDCVIEVVNTTEHDGKLITPIVESGKGYTYNESNGYPNPPYSYQDERPFMRNTAEELLNTNEHVIVLKTSLAKKGYKME